MRGRSVLAGGFRSSSASEPLTGFGVLVGRLPLRTFLGFRGGGLSPLRCAAAAALRCIMNASFSKVETLRNGSPGV